jgi:putative spermidine/putrescine transport system ATP-binding protein
VDLRAVGKTFGTRQALAPISLVIEEGRKVVLLGPSGCGKTTALRLIAGLEKPDPGGRVFIGGQDVTGLAPEKRGVGMMFQSYALFPNLTVSENIAYGLKIRKVPKARREARVEELLALTRLSSFKDADVRRLSGGQRQRVALARALAPEPKVLLLDEPLGALDAALRESVREELDELLSILSVTAIIVTHDQGEAMSLGDRVVVMRDGRIEQEGAPAEIYREPATPFVAGFVGGSNRLRGRVQGGFLRLPGGVAIPLPLLRPRDGAAGPLPPEAEVAVYFRPDRPRLSAPGPGLLSGRVASSRLVGAARRLVVALPSGGRVKMELPAEAGWAAELEPGAEVGLDLPPEALMLFEED